MPNPPKMPPSARVTGPTPPISFSATLEKSAWFTEMPWAWPQASTRAVCVSITAGICAACVAIWLPANITSQIRNASAASSTIRMRKPRRIGSTRASRRCPPSIIAAKTTPPKITSSGCAR